MEITIKIDQRNKQAKALLEYIRTLPFVEVKDNEKEGSPYDPEFVKIVKESAASKERYEVDPNDVWGSLGLR